jgi:hypothetical protein
LGTFIGALTPLTKPFDIYCNYKKLAALPQAFYYSFQVVNNEAQTLYYQYLTSVTLASGSTAVIASQAATNLGGVGSGGNAAFLNQQIANMTTAPSAIEVETIVITVKRYTDSGYTTLFDTVTLDTINLHLYNDTDASVAIQVSQNFSGPSLDGWYTQNNGMCNYGDCVNDSSHYYDATSGYSMFYESNSCVGSSNQNYNGNNSFPLSYYAYNGYAINNTYTDAIIELYVKAYNGAGWMCIEVDYSDNSPSDYYIFYIPNNSNWFQISIHTKKGLTNTVKCGGWNGYGLSACGNISGSFSSCCSLSLGMVRVIGKTSGSF